MPDLSPKNNEIAKNNHYDSRYRYPLGGMATIRRYSQPTGADTFTSSTRTDTLRMARLRQFLSVGRSYYTPGSLRHVDLIRLCDRDGRVIRPF